MKVKPKKHLGQHFLTDENIAQKICDSLDLEPKNILEIGPGKGVLTKYLLHKHNKNFKAIEVDNEAYNYLNLIFPDFSDNFINSDFLKLDLNNLFNDNFQIIGNFPYNISSQILFKVIENREKVKTVVGMFQKEVADRIVSPPNNKSYGILSVLMQTWYDIEYLFTVKEGSFFPPPKVKSAVVKFTRNNVTNIGVDEKLYIEIVKTAFNQRRKMIRNSLSKFNLENNVYLEKRPEQLEWTDFVNLTKLVN
jgi:16S rRNA (adenine1518-N6/adenine1519-N6)-dimethyltransferase